MKPLAGVPRAGGARALERDGAESPVGVRFLDGGRTAAIVADRTIEIWDVASCTCERVVELQGDVEFMAAWDLLPGGAGFVWGGCDSDLRVFDWSGRERTRLSLAPGAEAYLAGEEPGLMRSGGMWSGDGTYKELSHRYAPYRTPSEVSVAPGGRAVAVAYGQAYVLVWDLEGGRLRTLLGEESPPGSPVRICRVRWALDGARIVTAERGGLVRLWDVERRRELHRVRLRWDPRAEGVGRPDDMPGEATFAGGLGPVAFTPDGGSIVAADGPVVRAWELRSGRERTAWVGHHELHPIVGEYNGAPRIHDLRFSADGRRVLTVGVDTTIRVWAVSSGRQLWAARPDPCCVDMADLSPDGRKVIWAGCPGARVYWVGGGG